MALDNVTGKKLWEFNVGAPVGIGGPSIEHGMLFVPASVTAEIKTHKAGAIFAFGLPSSIEAQHQQSLLLDKQISNQANGTTTAATLTAANTKK